MIGSRTTPLFVLAIAAATVSASAQRSAEEKKLDALLQSTRARQPAAPKQVTVAGQLLMPDGSAATGARLFIAPNNQSAAALEEFKIDSTGHFRRTLDFKEGQAAEGLVLSAVVPGKATLWRTYGASDKTLGSLALRLDPAATLTGQVVDVNGKPLSGIDIKFPHLAPDFALFREDSTDRGDTTGRPSFPFTEFLPATALKALYQARTDATGHFTLSGLPAKGQLRLKLGQNIILAPGSSVPIAIGDRKQIDAGILVAVSPGSVALHLTDRLTGKPAANVQALLVPKNFSTQDFSGIQDDEAAQSRLGGLLSDAKGNIAVSPLAPGEYRIVTEGMERLLTVTASHATRVDLAVRTGPFRGRIVDAAGKPVAGVPITLDTPSDPLKNAFGGLSGFGIGEWQRDAEGIAKTDKNGQFEITPFPWEATSVTLRGARGNAEARWSGSARNIGKTLEIQLRPGALITVKGRLVAPEGSHVKKQTVSLVRWQDAPRITWLSTATEVPVDAEGRFQVQGLRRGEGFSLLAGSPFGRSRNTSEEGFESPRFTTTREAGVQNLGDMVVHPLDSGQQILQLYGIGSREQLAQLATLLPPPSAASCDAARETLARYRSAMSSGDFAAVHQLTSRISAGWSEDRQAFMAHSALRVPAQQEMQPLRFVPGISLASLLTIGKSGGSPLNFSFGAAASDLQANPDWVVFATAGPKAVEIAGIVHREQGAWKVFGASSLFGNSLDSLFLLSAPGDTTPRPTGFHLPTRAPEAAQIDTARAVAEKYLAAWSHGDDATQLALTSPLSTGAAKDLDGLRKVKSQRLDEGICPVSDMN
ncbi:MAG: hypothetical protein JWN14_674, partial [Chthonomonadales bacterium]|nr:hypothetical protein [Chthonomonadales bacterium]